MSSTKPHRRRSRPSSPSTTPVASSSSTRSRKPILFAIAACAVGLLISLLLPSRLYWHRYQTQLRNTNYAAATKALESAERWWASTASVILANANILAQQGYDDRAMTAIVAAENIGADPAIASAMKSRLKWQSGNLDSRAQQYDTPGFTPDDYAAIAMGYIVRGNDADAAKVTQTWQQRNPQDASAEVIASLIAQNREDSDQAGKLLRDAIRKNPKHVTARFELAQHQYDQRNFDAALAGFESVISTLSPFVPAGDRVSINGEQLHASQFIRALILQEQDQIDEAEDQFQKLLETFEDDFAIRYSLANMYALQGNGDKILETLEPIIHRFPEDISLNYLMATGETLRGNVALANDWIDQYLKARRQLNQLLEAERIRGNRPPDPEFSMLLAETYLRFKWDDAKPWLDLAASLQPRSPRVRRGYRQFYENSGNFEHAARYSD
ncbi:tetratricopeptide repeat protein [Rhodopirellula europaea]|uniref:Membrane or secreted protein n=1 Tax=Rhodopirellula europaea 6C TaxID=1263867 RepID=M2AS10_9BACT|nr:tetratricopeptide repeat protein [Rhodopirellula europaea]EMB15467.1 membrane or secreted protein [Rhodopirellula europaea 6C]